MPEFDKDQVNINPEQLQSQLYKSDDAVGAAITDQLEGKTPEELEELKDSLQEAIDELDAEDLDKRNYVKISPTFYVQSVKNEEEDVDDGEESPDLFKILNPVEGTVETRELSDDEKKEVLVTQLKQSRQRFNPLSHPVATTGTEIVETSIGRKKIVKTREYQTNKTVNKYGSAYKQKRKRKNAMAKKSRKANR